MQPDESTLAAKIFAAKAAYRELTQTQVEPAILYNDLVNLASGLSSVKSSAILQAVNSDLSLRRQYMKLVKQFSFSLSPAQAAASTMEEMPPRQTEHFTLKFKRDRLEQSQIFALLTIPHPTENHNQQGVTLNIMTSSHCEMIQFPTLIDGTSQCLFDESDAVFQLLLDADAQISIMP